jgi:hypothetical protein
LHCAKARNDKRLTPYGTNTSSYDKNTFVFETYIELTVKSD